MNDVIVDAISRLTYRKMLVRKAFSKVCPSSALEGSQSWWSGGGHKMVLWEASRQFLMPRKLLLLHLDGKLQMHCPAPCTELCQWPRCAELQNFTALRWATSWLSHYPLLPYLLSSAVNQIQAGVFLERSIVYAVCQIPCFVKLMAPCPANKSLSCLYGACLTHDWIVPTKISVFLDMGLCKLLHLFLRILQRSSYDEPQIYLLGIRW